MALILVALERSPWFRRRQRPHLIPGLLGKPCFPLCFAPFRTGFPYPFVNSKVPAWRQSKSFSAGLATVVLVIPRRNAAKRPCLQKIHAVYLFTFSGFATSECFECFDCIRLHPTAYIAHATCVCHVDYFCGDGTWHI